MRSREWRRWQFEDANKPGPFPPGSISERTEAVSACALGASGGRALRAHVTVAVACAERIIGGGPASLLAAVLYRHHRGRVRVIDADESRAAKIPESYNCPGFFGIDDTELLLRVKEQRG